MGATIGSNWGLGCVSIRARDLEIFGFTTKRTIRHNRNATN